MDSIPSVSLLPLPTLDDEISVKLVVKKPCLSSPPPVPPKNVIVPLSDEAYIFFPAPPQDILSGISTSRLTEML